MKNTLFLSVKIILLLFIVSCKETNSTSNFESKSVAIPVYNEAYQENWEADKIADILQTANGAYVLVDPFEPGVVEHIATIKANGNQVGGYISIGTGEDYRADFNQLQPFLVTKEWGQWAGEYFVNETTTGIIPIMKARIDSLEKWGCDWVEFDNMDWAFDDDYRKEFGFKTTIAQDKAYFQELCDYVHQKGMKCMAKNMTEGAEGFDGVLYESYNDDKNWWDTEGTRTFLSAGKLVIVNHYKECHCDDIYQEYKSLYSDGISFICEDCHLKKYKHYNQ